MSQTKSHRRNRAKKQHEPKAKEPEITRKGLLAHPGGLVIGLAGVLFVAYVFNTAGLQVSLDAYLNGLNAAAKSHGNEATKYFVFVLPVVAVLLGSGIGYIVLSAFWRIVTGPVKEKRKKAAKAAAKQAHAAALAAAGIKVKAPEGRVLVRPARLDRRDRGVTKVYAAKG